MRSSIPLGGALALLLASVQPTTAAEEKVLVELFTSQGCSSCPPAEAFLEEELAGREDVLALEFHVDYWDRLGWPDPFALAEATARQRAYGQGMDLSYIYTPQMVVDGRFEEVGSRRHSVLRTIEEAAGEAKPVSVAIDGARGEALLSGPAYGEPLELWFVSFDPRHETQVERGENAGRRLANTNVVRRLKRLGHYSGGAATLALPLEEERGAGRGAAAVIVQVPGGGRVLGFASLTLSGEG